MREIRKATSLNCKSGVSAFVSRRTVIAHWLIPAEPAHGFFQGVINDLARRYDAPLFEPHVTVHVASNRADAAETAISEAARACKLIKLKAHLSLLYKKMPAVARRELADSIMAPFSEVIFDSLKAVRCISPTQNRADVEAWRVVAAASLSG